MLLLGTLIGLVWELPVFGLSAWTNTPIIEWATPLPLPTVVFLLAHSVWDGPLLTMGWLLARALTGEPAGALGLTVQVLWDSSRPWPWSCRRSSPGPGPTSTTCGSTR